MSAPVHTPASVPLTILAVWIAFFEKDTGRIVQVVRQSSLTAGRISLETGLGHAEIPVGIGADLVAIQAAWLFQETHYVDTAPFYPQIRERTPCPASLDGLTLRGLPRPCRIEITVPLYAPRTYDEADASEVDLSFDHPGAYTVRVLSAPHLPGVFTITV